LTYSAGAVTMRPEMSLIKAFNKPSIQGAAKAVKRERAFELSLPALVKGLDALDNEFQERTELSSISSQEVSFGLNSKVMIGSKVNLFLDIPKTLILERSLNLFISGRVIYVKADTSKGKKQLIAIRLEKNYKIHSPQQKKI